MRMGADRGLQWSPHGLIVLWLVLACAAVEGVEIGSKVEEGPGLCEGDHSGEDAEICSHPWMAKVGSVSEQQERSSQELFPLFWLHIPKTGSSLGNFLLDWACEGINGEPLVKPGGDFRIPKDCQHKFVIKPRHKGLWPIGDHIPLGLESPSDARHVVAIFRGPRHRLISHYFHFHPKEQESSPDLLDPRLISYEKEHHLRGAQTKMVLGKTFDEPDPHYVEDDLLEACNRVRSFGFAGITEMWSASICLFHQKFGGRVHPSSLINIRKNQVSEMHQSLLVDYYDPYDDVLFECVLMHFLEELFWTPCHTEVNDDIRSEMSDYEHIFARFDWRDG